MSEKMSHASRKFIDDAGEQDARGACAAAG